MNQPTIIVAYASNHVIGANNKIPWKLPGDMKHFQKITTNNIVVMGRKTWESLIKPLSNRLNIVISTQKNYQAEGAYVFNNIHTAIDNFTYLNKEIFIIGGEQIYLQSLSISKKIIATEIHKKIIGDTFFPHISLNEWSESFRESQPQENDIQYDFVTYNKI